MKSQGMGAHNTKMVFVHPHATGGVLVELVEEQPQNKRFNHLMKKCFYEI